MSEQFAITLILKELPALYTKLHLYIISLKCKWFYMKEVCKSLQLK